MPQLDSIRSGRDRVAVTIDGADDVFRLLQDFDVKTRKRLAARAMNKVADKVMLTMKRLSPVQSSTGKPAGQIGSPGALRKNIIASKFRRYKGGGVFTKVLLGTRKMMGIPQRERAYYPASMEFGFKTRRPAKGKSELISRAWSAYETAKGNVLDLFGRRKLNTARHAAGVARREVLNARRKIPGKYFVQTAYNRHQGDLAPAVKEEINREITRLNRKAARYSRQQKGAA